MPNRNRRRRRKNNKRNHVGNSNSGQRIATTSAAKLSSTDEAMVFYTQGDYFAGLRDAKAIVSMLKTYKRNCLYLYIPTSLFPEFNELNNASTDAKEEETVLSLRKAMKDGGIALNTKARGIIINLLRTAKKNNIKVIPIQPDVELKEGFTEITAMATLIEGSHNTHASLLPSDLPYAVVLPNHLAQELSTDNLKIRCHSLAEAINLPRRSTPAGGGEGRDPLAMSDQVATTATTTSTTATQPSTDQDNNFDPSISDATLACCVRMYPDLNNVNATTRLFTKYVNVANKSFTKNDQTTSYCLHVLGESEDNLQEIQVLKITSGTKWVELAYNIAEQLYYTKTTANPENIQDDLVFACLSPTNSIEVNVNELFPILKELRFFPPGFMLQMRDPRAYAAYLKHAPKNIYELSEHGKFYAASTHDETNYLQLGDHDVMPMFQARGIKCIYLPLSVHLYLHFKRFNQNTSDETANETSEALELLLTEISNSHKSLEKIKNILEYILKEAKENKIAVLPVALPPQALSELRGSSYDEVVDICDDVMLANIAYFNQGRNQPYALVVNEVGNNLAAKLNLTPVALKQAITQYQSMTANAGDERADPDPDVNSQASTTVNQQSNKKRKKKKKKKRKQQGDNVATTSSTITASAHDNVATTSSTTTATTVADGGLFGQQEHNPRPPETDAVSAAANHNNDNAQHDDGVDPNDDGAGVGFGRF